MSEAPLYVEGFDRVVKPTRLSSLFYNGTFAMPRFAISQKPRLVIVFQGFWWCGQMPM